LGSWAEEAAPEEEEASAGGGMKTYSKQFSDLQRERYKKKRELKARNSNLPPDALSAGHVAAEHVAPPGSGTPSQPETTVTAGTGASTQPKQGRTTLASLLGFKKTKTAGTNQFPRPPGSFLESTRSFL